MAGNRSITVTLRANVQDFKAQFDAATKAAEQTAKATEESAKRADTAMGRMVQSAQNNRQAWDTAGATLTGFGAAVLGGLGLATKAAMDWESAFAGVRKTVDASEEQFAALENGLRGMARELPASHEEIAAVAEAAGQLGIATPNILSFTRTMIDMGEATNLSADEAATALARFITVTGTSQQDIGRLGATVVGLGNNFATTEAEIVALSQRLAAAGTQAGLSEGEIMGLATAMSQVGIEAEAGGSAMTQSMNRMALAVEEGGESLDLFAAVSGMTAEQFTAAWENDPAQALVAFTEGLADTSELGMSTNGVLTELGITGLREADTMRRLALATGVMSDAMAMGNAEFEKGTALIEEANQRYQTAESRIAIAGNAIRDAGISIGGTFLPVLAEGADVLADFAGYFADLPGPMHTVIGTFGAVAGAASLAGGAFLLTFPRVMDTVSAFRDLAAISPRASSGLGKVGKAAGVAAGAFVALSAAGAIAEMFSETAISAEEMSSKLANLAATAVVSAADINELVSISGTGGATVKDFGYAIDSVNMGGFLKGLDTVGSAFGIFDSDVSLAKEQIASLDQALATFAMAGTMDHLTETFDAAVEAAAEYGYTAEDVIAQMPGLRTALEPIATGMGLTADNATLAKIAMGDLVPPMDEATGAAGELAEGLEGAEDAALSAAEAADELYESMTSLADGFLNARQQARDYKEALIDAEEALKENGKAWGDSTEKARENGEALDGVAQSVLDNAEAMRRNGEDVGGYLQGQREILWELAKDFGATDEQATAYVDSLGLIPEEIDTMVQLETEAAIEKWDLLWEELGYHPPLVIDPTVDPDEKVPQFTGLVGEIPLETNTAVGVETDESVQKMYGFGEVVEGATEDQTVTVDANIEPAQGEVNQLQTAINESGGTVTINGDAIPGNDVLNSLMGIINSSDGTVTIDGQSYPADQALSAAIQAINDGRGVVEIDGNNSGANSATDSAVGHANRSSGSIKVDASTGSAERAINHAARSRRTTIFVGYSDPGFKGSGGASRFATGGAVYGAGTETSDSIPALLSNNEHVFAAREVKAAGGHQAIYSLRQQLMAGAKTLHLATGGGVENGSVAPVRYAPVYQQAHQAQAGPSILTLDGAALGALSEATRTGASQATLTMSDRMKASVYQGGKSASRAYGGAR